MVNIADVTEHDLPELADLSQQLSPNDASTSKMTRVRATYILLTTDTYREGAQRFNSSAGYTSHGHCAFKKTL